jgi:hypothetical protein
VGQGSEHLIRSVLAHQLALPEVTGLSNVCAARSADTLYEPAWALYQRHYRQINGRHSAVYPGAAEGLALLKASGLPMACLTNKPRAFALDLLKAKGLEGFFALVFGGDSFERKKPDPLPLIRTCEALGSKPALTFLLESVVGGERFGRYSFIGLPARTLLRASGFGDEATEVVTDGVVVETDHGNPLDFIAAYQQRFKVALRPGLPRFCGGLAGYFGYDAVRYIEKKLESTCPPDTWARPTSCCCSARSWRSSTTCRASCT